MIAPAPALFRDNLIVPIAVLPPLAPDGKPRLVCPPFIVPPGSWVISWNLVTIVQPTIVQPELGHATFPEIGGIQLLFGQDPNFTHSAKVSETQWLARITNIKREDRAMAFPLAYLVSFFYPMTVGGQNDVPVLFTSEDRDLISHDPTIVVSQDPIESPIY
ncbi:MAG TPA: hypothetical protein VGS22_00860 [Thermoanaerobaculia bacterium]|jgi:hypothetical protein|nr:hypothetical protein [Thermoanaerobaculia bacterium]